MTKTMEIGGKSFEVIRPRKFEPDAHHKDYRGRRTLLDYYDKPSDIKLAIWQEWVYWERHNPEVYDMRITGASGFTFTIGAYYVDTETDEIIGYFKITKDHNRLYLF